MNSAVLAAQTPIIDVASLSLGETTVRAALRLASGQAAIGATASAIALTEGVLEFMFWSKLKLTVPVVLASSLLCGTVLMAYRAMGLPHGPVVAGKQPPRVPVGPEGKPTVPASSGVDSPELDAIGKARIEVAAKLRDAAQRLQQEGEVSVVEYLTAQKRYDDVVADVMVKTDADRLRLLEREITTFKRIEDGTRELFHRGVVTQGALLTAELARLDAEYALAKAKAKARGNAK